MGLDQFPRVGPTDVGYLAFVKRDS